MRRERRAENQAAKAAPLTPALSLSEGERKNYLRLAREGQGIVENRIALTADTGRCQGQQHRLRVVALALAVTLYSPGGLANPAGGTVIQGRATFSNQGSQFTIRTSDRAFINWQSFNIGLGETTTFLQPSSSSVVWNQV